MIAPNKENGAVLRARTHLSGNDLPSILRGIWRRRNLPLIGLAVGLAIGIAVLFVSPAVYKADARVMLDGQSGQERVLSEIEVMISTPVLAKTAGVLGLYNDPVFRKAGLFEGLFTLDEGDNAMHERVLQALLGMIKVRHVPQTNIIEIAVLHENPKRAAQIANVLLSSYKERKNDERYEQGRMLGKWMERRLNDIRAEGAVARKKLNEAAAKQTGVQGVLSDKALDDLATQIAEARADIGAFEAQGAIARAGTRTRVVDRYAAKRAQLKAEIKLLSRDYGEKHPKMIAARAALAKLPKPRRVRVDVAPNGQTKEALEMAQAHLRELESKMQAIQHDLVAKEVNGDVLGGLQTEVLINERLYENLRLKYQNLLAQAELQDSQTRVLSMAGVPSMPERRGRIIFMGVVASIGFLAGLLLAVFRVLWNTAFTSVAQLENMTGYPVFATIPAASGKGQAVHQRIIDRPAALLAESLRSLRVSLRLRADAHAGGFRPRVVALTSTLPEEGKTSIAAMLAVVAAKSGERVIVVDCDLRRPSVHKTFAIGNARGLQDCLNDTHSVDEVIYRKDPSGVHLLTTKAVPSYSLTLLTSGRMEQLIDSLRERYDLVILDAPSSLAFADARVLARMVDQSLYVVAWNKTRRDSVLASLKAYADMGYTDLAVVLNKVNLHDFLRDSASAVIYRYGEPLPRESNDAA